MSVWDNFELHTKRPTGLDRCAWRLRGGAAGVAIALALAAATTTEAAAQWHEHLRFEPWGGALWDAYRNEGGNGNPAWIGAARLAYELGPRATAAPHWRLIAEVARAEAAEAGTATLQDSLLIGFRTEWWLTTLGVERDLVGGWMGVTLEARGGVAWIEREIVGGDSIPAGTPGTSAHAEPDPFPVFAGGISFFRHLTHAVQLRVRLEDIVTDPFEELEHSPALGLGLRFVFE